jgi:hypothetical protein
MRLRIARQVVARLSADLAVEHHFAAGVEERLRCPLFVWPNAREDFSPRDGRAEGRDACLVEPNSRLQRVGMPSQNRDDDVRIQDDAG